jgi:transposase
MRQGHDGLMSIVLNTWTLDPYSGHIFAFVGKRRDRIKLLYFDRGGLVVTYKRLERGQFKLPPFPPSADRAEIDGTDLTLLLDGIDVTRVRRPARWKPPSIKGPIDEKPAV